MQQRFILSRSSDLKQRSLNFLNQLRTQNLLCDVTLVVNDIEIPAHKVILASDSPYFYTTFTESRQDRIIRERVDGHAVKLLIEYLYTSTLEINKENAVHLLTAAYLLELTHVRDACWDYLRTHLNASNCLSIRDVADMHGCKHFNEVIGFDEFLNLTHEKVIGLISDDDISVSSEEKVYECVINWLRYDKPQRQQHTADLMQHVRLPLLARKYITQKVNKEPLLKRSIKCRDLIIEALNYHLEPSEITTVRTIPRKPVDLPRILLVIGGRPLQAIRSVECYDLRKEKWHLAADMPFRRNKASFAVLGKKVYAVGGISRSSDLRTVDVYDPATNR
uniref:BTB domain-containing protein n=1 Tax=Glossina palpalis gambiensis TaxID=67801 RepID=A0A1B0AXS4_9MUSC